MYYKTFEFFFASYKHTFHHYYNQGYINLGLSCGGMGKKREPGVDLGLLCLRKDASGTSLVVQ